MIYILGTGHSGSTLLSLVLGSHDRILNVGEIHQFAHVWQRQAELGKLCPCGEPLLVCSFWSRIVPPLQHKFGKEWADMMSSREREFATRNAALCELVLMESNKQIVCDSSKGWPRLNRLMKSNMFDIHVVHLVRDPRAVAYSYYAKARKLAEPHSGLLEIAQFARRWSRKNLAYQERLKAHGKHTTLRYEDFVRDTTNETQRILAALGLEWQDALLQFRRTPNHVIAGNHMRYDDSEAIVPDRRFLSELRGAWWWIPSLAASRGLRHFGYSMSKDGARLSVAESPRAAA